MRWDHAAGDLVFGDYSSADLLEVRPHVEVPAAGLAALRRTEEDLDHDRLPPRLRAHRSKLFGLTIDPVRLQQIRQERRPNSRYAQLETCRREVSAAEMMFRAERLPTLSTTYTSIEEIASKVLTTLDIQREMF